jgi:hypothetical protein
MHAGQEGMKNDIIAIRFSQEKFEGKVSDKLDIRLQGVTTVVEKHPETLQ